MRRAGWRVFELGTGQISAQTVQRIVEFVRHQQRIAALEPSQQTGGTIIAIVSARLADHERRIIVLEHRLRHIERLVHRMLNATTKAVDMEQSG